MYGGMAALGALAYRAYGDWQRKQGAGAAATPPQTLDRLPAPQAEQQQRCADRDDRRRQGRRPYRPRRTRPARNRTRQALSDASDRSWLEAELARPLDPAAVAQAAATPEMAAEMYLASLLVVDEESFMERAYLDELARQLKLPPDLKLQLEQHAKAHAQTV